MNYYCLVPSNKITTAMINRSVSASLEAIPLHTLSGVEYGVIEIEENVKDLTNVFDDYKWHKSDEIHAAISNQETGNGKAGALEVISKVGVGIDSLRPRCLIFTAAANSTTNHYFQMDVPLSFRGGVMFSNGQLGDYVRISVCDKDNILGYGSGFEIAEYVKSLAIFPSCPVELLDLNVSEPVPQGLYFKIEYTNTNLVNAAKAAINFYSYVSD